MQCGSRAETTLAPRVKPLAGKPAANTVAPVRKVPVAAAVPNGRYTASGTLFSLTVTFDSKAMMGAIEVSFAGRKINGSEIPFVMHGSTVQCTAGQALDAFLSQLPVALAASDLVLTFDAAADQLQGSIMGFSVTGKK